MAVPWPALVPPEQALQALPRQSRCRHLPMQPWVFEEAPGGHGFVNFVSSWVCFWGNDFFLSYQTLLWIAGLFFGGWLWNDQILLDSTVVAPSSLWSLWEPITHKVFFIGAQESDSKMMRCSIRARPWKMKMKSTFMDLEDGTSSIVLFPTSHLLFPIKKRFPQSLMLHFGQVRQRCRVKSSMWPRCSAASSRGCLRKCTVQSSSSMRRSPQHSGCPASSRRSTMESYDSQQAQPKLSKEKPSKGGLRPLQSLCRGGK